MINSQDTNIIKDLINDAIPQAICTSSGTIDFKEMEKVKLIVNRAFNIIINEMKALEIFKGGKIK